MGESGLERESSEHCTWQLLQTMRLPVQVQAPGGSDGGVKGAVAAQVRHGRAGRRDGQPPALAVQVASRHDTDGTRRGLGARVGRAPCPHELFQAKTFIQGVHRASVYIRKIRQYARNPGCWSYNVPWDSRRLWGPYVALFPLGNLTSEASVGYKLYRLGLRRICPGGSRDKPPSKCGSSSVSDVAWAWTQLDQVGLGARIKSPNCGSLLSLCAVLSPSQISPLLYFFLEMAPPPAPVPPLCQEIITTTWLPKLEIAASMRWIFA